MGAKIAQSGKSGNKLHCLNNLKTIFKVMCEKKSGSNIAQSGEHGYSAGTKALRLLRVENLELGPMLGL